MGRRIYPPSVLLMVSLTLIVPDPPNSGGIFGNKIAPPGRGPEKANCFRKWSIMTSTFKVHNLGGFIINF